MTLASLLLLSAIFEPWFASYTKVTVKKDYEVIDAGVAIGAPQGEVPGSVLTTNTSWPMFGHDPRHTRYSSSAAPRISQVLWTYETGGAVTNSPAVADGMVFVGSHDHNLYALNETTGQQIWNYTTQDKVMSSPAVADGMVFIAFYSEDFGLGAVLAFNETTGQNIWLYPVIYPAFSDAACSPAVADGMLFICTSDHTLHALDETTGEQIWNYTIGQGSSLTNMMSSPAVADGMLFIGSDNHNIYCFGLHDHDVAVLSMDPASSEAYPTWIVPFNITVTVGNEGKSTETFNVTAYYDSTAIGTQAVTDLAAGAQKTLTFSWDLTDVPLGYYNHLISAQASVVSGENDTIDNTLNDGTVKVKGPGDIDGDGGVGSEDLFTLAPAYATKAGYPLYNPACDFDGDGDVDSMDLFTLAANYCKKYFSDMIHQ